jgi:opacity protein-like surface antigen
MRGLFSVTRRSSLRGLALALLLGTIAPAAAHADGLFTPFAGINFGGKSGGAIGDAFDAERFDWGVSVAFMSAGILGLEADLAHSPDFFGTTDLGGSSVLTATGNLLIGIPIGGQQGAGFRPYFVAGLGVIRSEIREFADGVGGDDTKAAWDVGGGAMFFFADHVGLRTEVRYFRTFGAVVFDFLGDLTDRERTSRLDFARASTGVILRF